MSDERPLTSVMKRFMWIAPLGLAMCIPTAAEGAWDLFSSILLSGGRAENPRFLDPSYPASERRGQTNGTIGLTMGVRGKWERTDLALSYSPSGEIYEQSDLNRVTHDLAFSWEHRHTPRTSTRILENFSYSPDRGNDPNIAALGGVITTGTNAVGNDFSGALLFRASEKSTFEWAVRDAERRFSADQYLDTSRYSTGVEYGRKLSGPVKLLWGYDFAVFRFSDGETLLAPPALDPNDICSQFPQDPNCIIVNPPASTAPATTAEDLGANRHRAYSGFLWEVPGGIHVALDYGYDVLFFDAEAQDAIARPYIKSTVGWNGDRLYTRVGYSQGLDEGGGVLTNAELRRSLAEMRFRITDRTFFDLSASYESRRSLDVAGSPPGGALRTFRGWGTYGFKLPREWVLFATAGHDRQTSTGTGIVAADIRANRYALGISKSFD